MLRTRLRLPLRLHARSYSLGQLKKQPEPEPDVVPDIKVGPLRSLDKPAKPVKSAPPTKTWASKNDNIYTGHAQQYISIPNILPPDVQDENTPEQHTLYPTSSVLDSISMISICLRRLDHIPRAYSIFRQLLQDYNSNLKPLPDADTFGKVCEGVSRLSTLGKETDELWRNRAARLVEQWEEVHLPEQISRDDYQAALKNNGIKVYQGWFNGLYRNGHSLHAIAPYFENGSLKVADIMAGVSAEHAEKALNSLKRLESETQIENLRLDIEDYEEKEKRRKETLERQVLPEIRPIMENEGVAKPNTVIGKDGPGARFAIDNLRKALLPLAEFGSPILRQRALEDSSKEAARLELERSYQNVSARDRNHNNKLASDQLQAWMHEWLLALTERLETDIAELSERVNLGGDKRESHKEKKDSMLYMHLQILDPAKLALVAILELMSNLGSSSGMADTLKVIRAITCIGKGVETEHQAQIIRDFSGAESKLWQSVMDPSSQLSTSKLIAGAWNRIGRGVKEGTLRAGDVDWSEVWTPSWSQQAHLDVGTFLLVRLLATAKVKRTAIHPKTGETVSEVQPAFAHIYEYYKGNKLGMIKCNPAVAARLSLDRLPAVIQPKALPMLVEPRKWTGFDQGGYLMHKVPIMRVREATEQTPYMKEAIKEKLAEAVLHGLDVLSSTPWKINRFVFDIMIDCWNRGEAIADIPASEENSSYVFPERDRADSDPRKRNDFAVAYKEVLSRKRKDHSERCKINYTLEVARAFLHDDFYLPHSMDFRGRCYPIPPHLSPVGDDLNRGLLLFAIGRPLGATGLRWLQIHLANVYGYDKLSFDERARFAEDHVDEIFDSADKPLDGARWWLKAEDPWQCLATCKELANALRSSDPSAYVSNFPVHQDGTCNGMQHYAALGGDVQGARAVNLEDGDRPADIYTRVVDIVNKVIAEDKERGEEMALKIKEPLTRKVVKQTVMTTVYGVTFIGARDQIAKQLANRPDIPQEYLFTISAYIAKTVLSCIGDLFAGARDIQDWLTTSARLISKSLPPHRLERAMDVENKKGAIKTGGGRYKSTATSRLPKELMTSVIWTTPLGLPVVQPYRKLAKRQIMTALQSVYVTDPTAPCEVSPVKQAAAFPPNYIHSLDATHMFLTALRCKQNNITFASVHDSYWTHAATVDDMSKMIRQSFIQLHEADLIGQLREEFIDRYGEHLIPINNAKKIIQDTKNRMTKEVQRRAKVRSVLSSHESPTSELTDGTEVTGITEEGEIDPVESAEPNEDADETKEETASLGLSGDELRELAKRNVGQDVEVHKFGEASFIKIKDLLPPKPLRGSFDVRKIADSSYFFS